MRLVLRTLFAGVIALAWASPVWANLVTWSASGTNAANGNRAIAASAEFTFDNSVHTLTIKLSNDALAGGSYVPKDLLEAVFFDINGSPSSLTYSTALASTLRTGNTVVSSGPGLNITSEWGYAHNTSGGLGGAVAPFVTQSYGLGTAGFGITPGFGLPGGQQLDYGIVDAGFTGAERQYPDKDLSPRTNLH